MGGPEQAVSRVRTQLVEYHKEITGTKEEADCVIYVGNGCCVSSLIEAPEQNIWILSATALQMENSYQFISRRYHYISQVAAAKVFGIIITSLKMYNQIAHSIKALLSKYDKSCYPIYLGKITDLKLGNFKEIDMFVLVSCNNAVLPDNRYLFKPIITPFELEAGLKGEWQGRYSTRFVGESIDAPIKANVETSKRFAEREFKGLEIDSIGSVNLEEGYSGIATKYKSEIA